MTDKTPEKKPEPTFSNPFANLTDPFATLDEKPADKPTEKKPDPAPAKSDDAPKPTRAEAKAEKEAEAAKAEAKADRAAARKLAKERREHPNPVLDAYDGQIAAAEAAGCHVIRLELSAAHWHQLNDAAGVKDDKDTYDGIPIEVVGDAVMPTVVAMHDETNLRQSYPVSIRGEVDPLSPPRR